MHFGSLSVPAFPDAGLMQGMDLGKQDYGMSFPPMQKSFVFNPCILSFPFLFLIPSAPSH